LFYLKPLNSDCVDCTALSDVRLVIIKTEIDTTAATKGQLKSTPKPVALWN